VVSGVYVSSRTSGSADETGLKDRNSAWERVRVMPATFRGENGQGTVVAAAEPGQAVNAESLGEDPLFVLGQADSSPSGS
jgi:hypothetical protein